MMQFVAPLLLAALGVVPFLWFLLRATPPAPRKQTFPPVSLLTPLTPKHRDAAHTPWWLLLLRVVAVMALILGLAQPVRPARQTSLDGTGAILLVVDNGWASAQGWADRIRAVRNIAEQGRAAKRPVFILPMAAAHDENPGGLKPQPATPAVIDALRPRPWPSDYQRAANIINRQAEDRARGIDTVFYLGDGIAHPQDSLLSGAFGHFSHVYHVRVPAPFAGPLTLSGGNTRARLLNITVRGLSSAQDRHLLLRAYDRDNGVLSSMPVRLAAGATQTSVSFALPAFVRNQVDYLQLEAVSGAAGIYLLDEGSRRRSIGLVSDAASDRPFLGTQFFIERALAPWADIRKGSVAALLAQKPSVIIATGSLQPDTTERDALLRWVRNGGILLRFAGPRPDEESKETGSPLLPVTLMAQARKLDGNMSWTKPLGILPFPSTSPFYGLRIPPDIKVLQQLLAEPSAALGSHTWATLSDATPLVTHKELGRGQIVLFHISGTREWSNLPISGLFVSMLRRINDLSSGQALPDGTTFLRPVTTLDGYGQQAEPPPSARGMRADAFNNTLISPAHPPGIYGAHAARRALNLGDHIPPLAPQPPLGAPKDMSGEVPACNFGPVLMVAGLMLLLLDALIGVALHRGAFLTRKAALKLMAVGLFMLPLPLRAQGAAPQAALETRLAYVISGHKDIDNVSRSGLNSLARYVNARSSTQLGPAEGVVPGRDNLSYYPLLYWPITADLAEDTARSAALSRYMQHGGIILVDTQGVDGPEGGAAGTGFAAEAPGTAVALRRALKGVNVPPLTRLDEKHLLCHTFYILHNIAGRYVGPAVWVVRDADITNDDISPLIIGHLDWAHAWAMDENGNPLFSVIPNGESQRLDALRFGVNLVIYALTGSYKADQVHVPALLKRLGR